MNDLLWLVLAGLAFLCKALPFSVWLGKLFQGMDIRQYSDGNPGATNRQAHQGKTLELERAGSTCCPLDVALSESVTRPFLDPSQILTNWFSLIWSINAKTWTLSGISAMECP
jgi:hypothetical protein